MKGIKLCSFALLASLSVALSTVLLSSSSVSAVSEFDDVISPQNSAITLHELDTEPITLSGDIITNIQNTCKDGLWPGGNLNALTESFYDAYIGNGTYVIGVQSTTGNGWLQSSVFIYWSEQENQTASFMYPSIETTPNHRVLRQDSPAEHFLILSVAYQDDKVKCAGGDVDNFVIDIGTNLDLNGQPAYITGDLHGTRQISSNYIVTYPPDYQGDLMPTSNANVSKLRYKIVDKLGEFTPVNIDISQTKSCKIFITTNPILDGDDGGATAEDIYTIPDCAATVNHTFPKYGYYNVRLEVENNDLSIDQYSSQFKIDGSTFSGNLGNLGDSPDGEDTPVYEDCSNYGLDVVGGFICVMSNFQKWIIHTLVQLFIPTSKDFRSFYNDLNEFLHQKLGLLLYPFDWIYTLYNSFLVSASACAGLDVSGVPGANLNATFFGSHVNLNVCSAQQDFPQIYNIAVFFVRTLAIFAMIAAVYRKFLVTIGDHSQNNNRTEALYK